MIFHALPEANQDAIANTLWYDNQQPGIRNAIHLSVDRRFCRDPFKSKAGLTNSEV